MSKVEVGRIVRRVGASGAHFQFREVRDGVGVETGDKNGSNRTWRALAELIGDGIVEEVPGDNRKRHKYYRVKDEEKLRGLLAANGIPKPGGAGPDRLARIEGDVRAILDRLDGQDAKLSQLLAMWG
jgi:hypothetical protein